MNVNKQWLTDESGNVIAPKTLMSAIQDEDGNAFQDYVDDMLVISEEETTEVPEELTSVITSQDIQNIVSDEYDNTKTYSVGDYCIKDNKLYKCVTAVETAEEFDSAKWEATTCGNEIGEVNNKLIKTYEFSHSASIATGEHKEVILHLGGIPEGATVLCAIGNLASNTAWIQTQVGMKADKSNVILGFYNTYTSTLDALVNITVLYI